MTFSIRQGHKQARSIIQLDSIDVTLRNGLWNVLELHIWRTVNSSYQFLDEILNRDLRLFCSGIWANHFKKALDEMPSDFPSAKQQMKQHFMTCQWFEVYDFVEFAASNYGNAQFKKLFINAFNSVLEKELSGYRFVGNVIAPVTSELELTEIDQALLNPRSEVTTHLRRATELLADRTAPDYRNSIKESISAVESLVILVLGEKATLGQLLKRLESEINLHPALKQSFSSIYGYTSDESGIRHALIEGGTKADFADAKLMLVMCSTFINFVEAKLAVARRGPK